VARKVKSAGIKASRQKESIQESHNADGYLLDAAMPWL
jgi:hypothetical protein